MGIRTVYQNTPYDGCVCVENRDIGLFPELLVVQRDGLFYDLERFLPALISTRLDRCYAPLEFFVCLEEMLVLFEIVFVEVGEVLYIIPTLVTGRNRKYLHVTLTVIYHIEDRNRTDRDQYARVEGKRSKYHHIQRVVVFPVGLWRKAVIEWIWCRTVICPIKCYEAGILMDLIFIVRPFRDLDYRIDDVGSLLADRNFMP